jgi:hypothetical protein
MHAVNNRSEDDFRRAAGLGDRGPGLYDVDQGDGEPHLTNVRKIAGKVRTPHAPGSVLIGAGGWLLALLGAGLFYVSFTGQFKYIFAARKQDAASMIEAGMLDVGMIIFTVLALGMARAGKPARTERTLILACAFGSAAMNYAAADTASPRSVVAYVAAPVFLAVVVDRVVAVIRRHVLGDTETSPWSPLGRFLAGLARAAGLAGLYLLRLVLDPPSTAKGLRQVVLNAAPLPDPPVTLLSVTAPDEAGRRELDPPERDERPGTKKAGLLRLYRAHPDYGSREAASRVAAELAGQAGFKVDAKGHSGSARNIIYDELARMAGQNGG